MTLLLREQEILSYADKALHQRSNMLGADGYQYEEPFVLNRHIALSETYRQTPDGYGQDGYGLTLPNYSDSPVVGTIGTRYVQVRLHPYLPSGKSGPQSVQTFVAVSQAPENNSIDALEAVRRKPLISSRFSQEGQNAAAEDVALRGFELALYPAASGGGDGTLLVPDTSNGPISPAADPGANSGDLGASGSRGFWYVDYEAGIVRFSRPPFNGSGGVMNPNNVFGDRNGLEDSANGSVTLFATYYKYDGEYGPEGDTTHFVTVGDGINSFGSFDGQNHNPIQSALNSLPDVGGTVFVKDGYYTFDNSVILPARTNVVGFPGTVITRPKSAPAFVIGDGYCGVEGFEINVQNGVTSSAAIELRSRDGYNTINEIDIKNNTISGNTVVPCVAFAPKHVAVTYADVKIKNNVFVSDGVHIGEVSPTSPATIENSVISENLFKTSSGVTPDAINFTYWSLSTANNFEISKNIGFDADVSIGSEFQMSRIKIVDNIFNSLSLSSAIDAAVISDNEIVSTLSATGQLTNAVINANNIAATASFADMNDAVISDGYFGASLRLASGITSGSGITGSSVSGNTIVAAFQVGQDMVTGNAVDRSLIDNNNIGGNVTVAAALTGTAGGLAFKDSTFSNNVCASVVFANSISRDEDTATYENFVMVGNEINGLTGLNGLVTDSNISNNIISSGGLTLVDNMLRSRFCNNTVATNTTLSGDTNAIGIDQSVISGNIINGALNICPAITSVGCVLDSVISDNVVTGAVSVGATFTSTTSGNICENTTFSGNVFKSTCAFGAAARDSATTTYDNFIMVENKIDSTLDIRGLITGSDVSKNTTTTLTISGALVSSTVSDNIMSAACSITSTGASLATNSKILGNIVGTTCSIWSTDLDTFVDSSFVNNNIAGATTLGITGNDEVLDSSGVSGNMFGSTFDIVGSFASSVVSNSSISNNLFKGAVTIDNDTGTDVLNNSSITNNMFEDTITISVSGAQALDDSIFSNNTGTDAVIAGGIESSTISGNVISTLSVS